MLIAACLIAAAILFAVEAAWKKSLVAAGLTLVAFALALALGHIGGK